MSTIRTKYININGKIEFTFDYWSNYMNNTYKLNLPLDFIQSKNDKYIIIRKLRLFNNEGQMDIGSCLASEALCRENMYSEGLNYNKNYIMSANELNEKKFKISSDIKVVDFTFTDYKGELINTYDDITKCYYYVLELELVY